jgi:uncharacterized protein YukJ
MSLTHGYGVVTGTVQNYYRDPPDDFGKYYHGNLIVAAPAGSYHCAIDVDSKKSNIGVEWRVVNLKAQEINNLTVLSPGWHALASTPSSGAIDYQRSSMFAVRMGCARLLWKFLGKEYDVASAWKRGTDVQALADLEPLVATTQNAGLKALVFGEPFTNGLGVHNIHQNQGDPAGSQWWAENGVWQDGCTILQQSATDYAAFLNKFTSQSYETDANGHPL